MMYLYIFQPKRLISPPSVLKRQKGNCFEYSTLLCSLLVGAGYDAYVVSGYATHETCLADESREICPLMKKREEVSLYRWCNSSDKRIITALVGHLFIKKKNNNNFMFTF